MAHVELTMTANSGDAVHACHGCDKPFCSGMRMNGVHYSDGDPAGWHCDDCVRIWQEQGEGALPRWQSPTRVEGRLHDGT